MSKIIELSLAGHAELEAEFETLVNTSRPAVIARIAQAKGFGDLSENSEYDDAKNEQGFIESRIAEVKHILENSVVVTPPRGNRSVKIGTHVEFKNCKTGDIKAFDIVASANANPLEGKMSVESPIGRALANKKKGDVVEIETPGGKVQVEVTAISVTK